MSLEVSIVEEGSDRSGGKTSLERRRRREGVTNML
jgi:hypothetical protein